MCQCSAWLVCFLVLCFVIFVTGFNIETKHFAVYQSYEPRCMFGFSTALHKERNRGWLLVGAPECPSRFQPSGFREGSVFKCPIDGDASCEEIPFQYQGSNSSYDNLVDKSEQWLGATLTTSKTQNGPVVACAPRYIWRALNGKRRDPVGTCYVSDAYFTQFQEYAPCRTSQWGYHRQGSCQAGFSAAINSNGDRLFVGAPGSWYWQGQMYSIDAHAKFPFTPGLLRGYGDGQVFQEGLETRPAVYSTKEGTAKDDDTYLGYSTITADFDGDGEQGIAVGMPRGADLYGKVLLYTWDLQNYRNFSSDQLGSYFGYCLAAADVNGDKIVDLIIGAPMYTTDELKYDVGRVYIIYQAGKRSSLLQASYAIDGFKSKSRFGQALSALGDINQDGYEDFAVGAPYDGPSENGAVYIYHGSEKGVREKYSQVIYAEDMTREPRAAPATFGFSVAGGMDLDGNDYPDFAVGAYLSDNAYFFRSRPVVRVEAFVKFLTPQKQIDLSKPNCRLRDGSLVHCTEIDFCVKYTGKNIPSTIELDVQYILDTKKLKSPRMAFKDAENINTLNDTIQLQKDRGDDCRRKQVYVKTEIHDKLTALEAEVKYSMRNNYGVIQEVRNPRSILLPILDLNSPPVKKDSLTIQKNCGPDNICIPNLTLDVSSNVNKYLLGSKQNLSLVVTVTNKGEDSFETSFLMKYPEGIFLKKIADLAEEHILCSNPSANRTIKCEIGNPLPAGKIAKFEIFLQASYREGMADAYEFDMWVNSTNPEKERDVIDNHQHLSIGIWVDSKIELRGVSHPTEVHYNKSSYESAYIRNESDIGPQVIHAYFLRNLGPVNIEEAEMFLLWPYATLDGDDFLYLLEQPHTLGNVKCNAVPANYRNIMYDTHFNWERINVKETAPEFTSTLTSGEITVETGGGTTGVIGGAVSRGQENITALVGSTGDASFVHQQRQNPHGSQASNYITSTTYSEYTTEVINGIPKLFVKNTTTISDTNGKVLDQFVHKAEVPGGAFRPSGSFGSSNVEPNGRIVTTHSRSETTIVNGVPVTTVTNTTTITDAATGKILHTDTVSSGNLYNTNTANFNRGGNFNNQNSYNRGSNTEVYHGITPNIVSTHSGSRKYDQFNVSDTKPVQNYGISGANSFEASGGHGFNQGQYGGYSRQSETEAYRKNEGNLQDQKVYHAGFGSTNNYNKYPYTSQNENLPKAQSLNNQYGTVKVDSQEQSQSQTGYMDQNGVYHSLKNTESTQTSNPSVINESYLYQRDRSTYGNYGQGNANKDFQEHGIGAAALGHGFTVAVSNLDNGNHLENVPPSVPKQREWSSSQEVSITGTYDPHTGKFIPDSNQASQSYSSRNNQNFGTNQEDALKRAYGTNKQWSSESHWSQSGPVPVSYSNNLERDNVPTDKPNEDVRYYGRKKREAPIDPYIQNLLNCQATKCITVRCFVQRLEPDKEVVVAMRSRVSARALRNISTSQPITLSSMAIARITRLPYIGKRDPSKEEIHRHEIFTTVPGPTPEIKSDVVPLWIVLLSAIAGTLILLLAIFALYKLGFFKRNRPSNIPEKQPLNRNGFHHGDDGL